MLPLNPTGPGSGNSPYFSHSAFAANPLLISFDRLIEEGLLSQEDLKPVPKFPDHEVDFDNVMIYKLQILDKAYRNFMSRGADDGFRGFCERFSAWLDDFALFMALKIEYDGKCWDKWPKKLRDRDGAALEKARKDFSERIEKEKFFQYLFFRQWFALRGYCNERGIKIVGDVPIYVSYDSADVWLDPHIFKLDQDKKPLAVSGVPPDYFSETGQLWNNPVYNWDVLKEMGYSWWIKRMRHTFEYFDIVRIDHFRGLVQYWEVPGGEETAMNGQWKDVPTYDFFDTLKKEFPGFPVIAEDLGLITDDVREAMKHYGFPGMKVLQFAFGEDKPDHPYLPHNFVRNCVAYTGTHDNNTMKGWLLEESTPEERSRMAGYLGVDKDDVDAMIWGAVRALMMSVADTVIIPVQDILELDQSARMNQPKTGRGNWKWRLMPGQFKIEDCRRFQEDTRIYGRAR